MFDRILVALDESEKSGEVMDAAIKLAKAMKAELRCCHVITLAESDFPGYPLAAANVGFVIDAIEYEEGLQGYAKERQAFEARHLGLLQNIAQNAVVAGIPTDHCLVYGDPGKQICQMADDWKADTIVIGRRGHSGLKELWLGSVCNYVLHHAFCTVLVIQGKDATKLKPDAAMHLAHA
jgi:nucleotide-binding universal stress UspA family protein